MLTLFLFAGTVEGLSGCRKKVVVQGGVEVEIPPPAIVVNFNASPVYAEGDVHAENPAALCNLAPEYCARIPSIYPCINCGTKPLCPPCEVAESTRITIGRTSVCSFIYDNNVVTADHKYDPNNFRFPQRYTNGGPDTLPLRNRKCPWLLMMHIKVCSRDRDKGPACYPSLFSRDDILWLSVDLGDWHLNQDGVRFRGVTVMPPTHVSEEELVKTSNSRSFLLSFLGNCGGGHRKGVHNTRGHMLRLFRKNRHPNVSIVCVSPDLNGWAYTQKNKARYIRQMNTVYAIVPHGDNRWNYRFTETILAGAIPVIVSDGLEMPMGELIDWASASVRILEAEWATFTNVQDVLDRLPLHKTAELQKNVAVIRDMYFVSHKRNASILSAIHRKIMCTQ